MACVSEFLFFFFSNNITNGLWYNGWFLAMAWMRTKSCRTIPTLSSCSIDLHADHGPPFFFLLMARISASGLYLSSNFTKSVGGLQQINYRPLAGSLHWRLQLSSGKTLLFSQPLLLYVWLVWSYEAQGFLMGFLQYQSKSPLMNHHNFPEPKEPKTHKLLKKLIFMKLKPANNLHFCWRKYLNKCLTI